MADCRNCNKELLEESLYCGYCGQKTITERYTIKKSLREAFAILTNFERGFLFTIKELFVAPERVIRDYLNGKTKQYYHPFKYLFILASLTVLVSLNTDLYDAQQGMMNGYIGVDQSEQSESQQKINEQVTQFTKQYLNLIYLMMIPFISFFTYRFFRKEGLNYAENIISNSFVFGQFALIGVFTSLLYLLFPSALGWGFVFSTLIILSYMTYVYHRLYKISIFKAFYKTVLSYVLGYVLLFLLMMILGIVAVIVYFLFKKITGM